MSCLCKEAAFSILILWVRIMQTCLLIVAGFTQWLQIAEIILELLITTERLDMIYDCGLPVNSFLQARPAEHILGL